MYSFTMKTTFEFHHLPLLSSHRNKGRRRLRYEKVYRERDGRRGRIRLGNILVLKKF